ncbi:polysaccharide biosynthesis tyrosine autokinase [Aureimonas leprariae]|uniref:non-specific protein-tyrosine kinase n=1 Tax=Plantimonas leprariae TaxID=2615207 RepID=A0A7V7PN02_9HYPH|nr:polysaccharide biosynthesis tyrosine autokinase [Aureimonas leprariae]KAB0678862.1 polysaccharide biosynthesis tyrosine autokinase [Aureimonas leprariae]
MLQDARAISGTGYGAEPESEPLSEFIDLDRILAAARRQWRIVAAFAILGGLLGLAYVVTAIPQYTSSADLLIDSGGSNRIVDEISASAGVLQDEPTILSQVELLKSERIGLSVVDRLKLADNAAFMAPGVSVLTQAKQTLRRLVDVPGWFRSEDDAATDEPDKRQLALGVLGGGLEVTRVARTFVLDIAYTSPDKDLAAKIAQTYAEAYLADQLDSKYEATRRASGWLQQRIEELRDKSLQSDLAVQKFRADHGLITADGRLVSDQQLQELNTQLTQAQAEVATAKARYDRITSLVESGDTNAVVNDALASSVINALRTKYLDTAKREGELERNLGPNHIQVIRLKGEMNEYRNQMFGELSRIAGSYQNDYQVAQARETSVRSSVEAATGVSAGNNETQVQLRELEREAETYRNLYQTFLQRYQEAVQQQSFPVTEARIISGAQPASFPSKPRRNLALAIAIVLGGAVGAGLGAFREFRDRFFRTGDQVRDELGMEFLGLAPMLKNEDQGRRSKRASEATAKNPRIISDERPITRYALNNPMSSFAETLRSAKIASDLTIDQHRSRIIGIVSALPSEGKSTIAANMAQLLMSQGSKTILIDGDIRNPGLTRSLAPHGEIGIVEGVLNEKPLSEIVMMDAQTKLAFVPAVVQHRVPHTAELLASHGMSSILAEATSSFDYVLIDLPPLAPVVDVRAIAPRIDAFVLVVEWGHTARRMVRSALAANPMVADKCIGVILNKVDSEKMKLYREFGSSEYYFSRYSSYYHEVDKRA